MKKLSKINLAFDKEVISSLSGNEMNTAKGGTIVYPPATDTNCTPCLNHTVPLSNCDLVCSVGCTLNTCQGNSCGVCKITIAGQNTCDYLSCYCMMSYDGNC